MKITLNLEGQQFWTTVAPMHQNYLDFYRDTPDAAYPFAPVERGSHLYRTLAKKLRLEAVSIAALADSYLCEQKTAA